MKDKKILQEEILSDKELNGVAGGTVRESWEIFQVLNKKNAPSLYDMPGYLKKILTSMQKLMAYLIGMKATQIFTVVMVKLLLISKFWILLKILKNFEVIL